MLDGFEAIAIVAVLAVVFLWGPDKLPEIARAMAEAKKEFDKASKEASRAYQQATALTPATTLPLDSATQPAIAQPAIGPPPTEAVIVAAKSMGISTEGKTREELVKETIERSMKK